MNYYGGSRPPVTRRAGHRARVTVETGGPYVRVSEQQQIIEPVGRFNRNAEVEQIRLRRQQQLGQPAFYPITKPSTYSSPGLRPSVPVSEPPPPDETEYVIEVPATYDDGDELNENVDFKLPKVPTAVKFSDDIAFVIPDSGSNDPQEKPPPRPKFTGQMDELFIQQSQWVGNTFERGDLGAELSVMPIRAECSEKQSASLMRWYHLHRPMMSFEEFMAASQSVLELPEKEQRDVSRLLKDVQKKFEKQRHHGREMEPDCVSDVFYNDFTGKSRQTESVLFLSFPYFCLETYNSAPIKSLDAGSPLHPARPMLQANFYSSTHKRELAQAIGTLPTTPNGECVHVSQLWCLVVNGSTMVTCSRLSSDALCGETITKQIISAAITDDQIRLKVSMGNDRSWMIPITPGTSWPSFLAFFGEKVAGMEAQGASAKFEYNKQPVDGKVWHDLIQAARESPIELTMQDVQFHVQEADEQMVEDQAGAEDSDDGTIDSPDQEYTVQTVTIEPSPDPSDPPRVIYPTKTKSMPLEPDNNLHLFKHGGSSSDMRELADSLHKILLSNERTKENEAYRQCPKAKASDIALWLASDGKPANRSVRSKGSPLLRKPKRRIVLVAKYLFCLFWPLDFEHSMTDQFWGALSKILNREDEFYVEGHNDPRSDVSAAIDMYNVLHDDILPLASMLAQEFTNYEQDLLPLPDAFSKAWLHLVVAIVLTAERSLTRNTSFHESVVSKHLHAIPDELEKGKVDIMTRLHADKDLDEFEICTESSILALLVNQIARDVMHGAPDVTTSYTDYFSSLEFNITQDPAPRYHQETVRYFIQEVQAILATLQSQFSVMDTFQQSLEQQSAGNDAMLIYCLGDSRQSVVINDCKARIGGKIDKFKGLQKRAEDLGEWHRNEMDTHKDRQENAILVFTIVTIIFLPLSFVSSVFGMNTTDIRDMPYSQWAYWAAGVPLTILVVFGSLWFAGELKSIRRWFVKAMPRSKSSNPYRGAQEPDLVDLIRTSQPEQVEVKEETQDLEMAAPPKRRTTYPRGELF